MTNPNIIKNLQLNMTRLLQLTAMLLVASSLSAQTIDLNNLDEKKKLKLSGGLSAGMIGYAGNSMANRNPYTWNVAGNLNLRILETIDIPVSMNISNANRELKVPNTPSRLSIHPTYKGVTAHIGDVNMTYSPYSLNGHQFTGVGVEIAPQKRKFRYSAMGGKFQQAVEYDSAFSNQLAAYERWGYGGKVQFVQDIFDIGLNVFTAKDRENSLVTQPDTFGIVPQQNLVGTVDLAFRPFKGFEIKTEFAMSALTQDIRDQSEVVERTSGMFNLVFPENNSTAYYTAQKISMNYQKKTNQIGVGYEKIDPGYRTLGAYFFANDLENITLNLGKVMMKNKLSVFARGGIQRDDLDGNKAGANQRFVGSLNTNFTPNERFNLGVNYSNFRTFMRIKSQFQFINQLNQYQALDTFNFTQISQNLNINSTYVLKQKDSLSHSLIANLGLQDVYAEQGGNEQPGGSNTFYNVSLAHAFQNNRSNVDIVTGYFYTHNMVSEDKFITQGPSLTVGKKLFKKAMRISASVNYNNTSSSNSAIDPVNVINSRVSLSVRMKKSHNLSLSAMQQNRGSDVSQIGSISYYFTF